MEIKKPSRTVKVLAILAMAAGLTMYVIGIYRYVNHILDFGPHASSLPAPAQPAPRN